VKIWKYSRLDCALFIIFIGHFVTIFGLAAHWNDFSFFGWLINFIVLTCLIWYNIIVLSHQFTHTPWFRAPWANRVVSIINSVNIGQSMEDYHLRHVRNHHRYHNDRKMRDQLPSDWASTFRDGKDGEHASLLQYTLIGAFPILFKLLQELVPVNNLWRVGKHETDLLPLLSRQAKKRADQLRQMQVERIARFLAVCVLLTISWQWTLLVYFPVLYVSLVLFNLQNYYEHMGAIPESTYANSVSHYGRIYNLLTCNDGYHQEHHLRPQTHWRQLPRVRHINGGKLDQTERIISPVPAIAGFLHRNRPQLHRNLPNLDDLSSKSIKG